MNKTRKFRLIVEKSYHCDDAEECQEWARIKDELANLGYKIVTDFGGCIKEKGGAK